MRFSIITAVLATLSAGAAAQDAAGPWQFFGTEGGRNGASVKAADGSQLVLKCDKPGSKEVHAILLSPNEPIAIPNIRPISRPITFQFDGKAPKTEDWSFYEKYAMTQGKPSGQTLAHLVSGLRAASKVRARLSTGIGSDVELNFEVAGAADAIKRVYESCKDAQPA